MFKKFLLTLLTITTLSMSLLAPAAQAQTWYLQEYDDWYGKVYDDNNPDEIFGERYTAAQVEWIIYSIIAFIFNHVLTDQAVLTCILQHRDDPEQCTPQIINAIIGDRGETSNLAQNSNPLNTLFSVGSISGIGYIKEKIQNLSLVSPVHAQGFGFTAGNAVQTLWVAVRNLTYALLIFIIIVMAFMIMFRVKLSPQTVISVQSALPKLIIALILITFSYAIAGFMVDLMYVVFGIIAALFSQSGLFVYAPLAGGGNLTWNDMFNALIGGGPFSNIFTLMFSYFLAFTVTALLALSSNVIGFINLFTGGTEILWIIIVVVALIVLFIVLLRIAWMLVRTFVMILLTIVIGPILILFGALGWGGFGSWIRTLAAHLAVFPVVATMLAVSFLFLAGALPNFWIGDDQLAANIPFNPSTTALDHSPWTPPWLPIGRDPVTNVVDLDIVWLFASLVVLTIIPRVSDIIRGMLSGRPFPLGTAIGEAFGPARNVGRMGAISGASAGINYLEGTGRAGWFTQAARRVTGIRN